MKFGLCLTVSFPDSGEAGEGDELAAACQASWCISSVYCSYSSKLSLHVISSFPFPSSSLPLALPDSYACSDSAMPLFAYAIIANGV